MLGADIKKMSMKKVQRGGMWLILFKALTSRAQYFLAGGFVMVRQLTKQSTLMTGSVSFV
jgi:hypothetical protein